MIVIGEKINGSIPRVKKAIAERDEMYIRDLAIRQSEAGAHYLDVCAGTSPDDEVKVLLWLMDIVQSSVDTPLCIDSPHPRVLGEVLGNAKRPGIVNSVSDEGDKCDVIYPLIKGTDWQVIALTCDDIGIPSRAQKKIEITQILVEKAQKYDIEPSRIHIDPLVMALSADNQTALNFFETVSAVKKLYPTLKITSGLSNVSFGLPLRGLFNRSFLAIAMYVGMDSAILDPCDKSLIGTLLAVEAILGRDRLCRTFTNAYRRNEIGH